ncbi:hypothetical protein ABZT03_33830 [Streptomyces sp. NPDC005574]|uniref:hypothetical protein n=1 Tax=Streptomyces sp. NPDC005574 TaxID=3156891 RepID=UPI0033BD46DE
MSGAGARRLLPGLASVGRQRQREAELLTDALRARGVAEPLASLCAQVDIDTYSIAIRRWGADRSDDLHTHLDRAFNDLRLAANALKWAAHCHHFETEGKTDGSPGTGSTFSPQLDRAV